MECLYSQNDTIAAIATGMTQAGIGIIRISGTDAFGVADKVFRSKTGQRVSEYASHTLHMGVVFDTGTVDQVLLSVFRAPHSYTGEDTVEINCHGGMFLCRKILEIVLQNGARLAEPGEFTKRAFLNGRMDLSQAEAVMDLIAAKNEFAAKNSMEQLSGSVKEKVQILRDGILHEIAYIEAALDDPEHYDLTGYPMELRSKTEGFLEETGQMLQSSVNGRIRKDGIRTAILGKPNAGKSSILNLLSGHESAIVTDIAGTTRDAIEESVRLGEIQLNLTDTAGIREASDAVERIGVERARKIAADADLILYVVDSSVPLDENDRDILSFLETENKNAVILYNKSDLSAAVQEADLQRELETIREEIESPNEENENTSEKKSERSSIEKEYHIIQISAKEGTGLTELQETLTKMFLHNKISVNDEVILTNLRQIGELRSAEESLKHVLTAIDDEMPEDFYSIDLTDAYRHLGFIIGEELADDIADRIFSEFCMGK